MFLLFSIFGRQNLLAVIIFFFFFIDVKVSGTANENKGEVQRLLDTLPADISLTSDNVRRPRLHLYKRRPEK